MSPTGWADELLALNRLPNALSAGQFCCVAFVGVPPSGGIFGSRAALRRDSNKGGFGLTHRLKAGLQQRRLRVDAPPEGGTPTKAASG